MFIVALVGMIVVSFLMALISLRKELKKPKEIQEVKRELMKEKVLFLKD